MPISVQFFRANGGKTGSEITKQREFLKARMTDIKPASRGSGEVYSTIRTISSDAKKLRDDRFKWLMDLGAAGFL